MRRAALIGVQLVVAVLVGLAIRELWLSARGDDATGSPQETIAVTTSVTPNVHTFGAPVVATADVVVDARLVRPDTVRIETDFDPYELTGEPTIERQMSGDVARVVFHFPLRCLREGCEPAEARGVAQFEAGFVRYRFRDDPGTGRGLVDWPPVEVVSRVAPVDVERIRWIASETELPRVTTRFGPTGLAIALLVAGLALAGAAVWLARRLWHVEPVEDEVDTRRERPPLERSLELARAEHQNGAAAPDRRRALERVARELSALGLHDLADEARALAWSPVPSTSEEVESFARRTESQAGTGAPA